MKKEGTFNLSVANKIEKIKGSFDFVNLGEI